MITEINFHKLKVGSLVVVEQPLEENGKYARVLATVLKKQRKGYSFHSLNYVYNDAGDVIRSSEYETGEVLHYTLSDYLANGWIKQIVY